MAPKAPLTTPMNTSSKIARNSKNFQLQSVMTFFGKCLEKYRHYSQIFKPQFSDLLVSVSKFWTGFGIKVSTAPLGRSNDSIRPSQAYRWNYVSGVNSKAPIAEHIKYINKIWQKYVCRTEQLGMQAHQRKFWFVEHCANNFSHFSKIPMKLHFFTDGEKNKCIVS